MTGRVDKITFRIQESDVQIFINRTNLIDMLKKYELPLARKDDQPSIAGAYMGMSIYHVNPSFRGDFLWKEDDCLSDSGEKKTTLLCCDGCGNDGCWSMLVKIIKEGDQVIWKDFEQPHRAGDWDYTGFGPFRFDRREYEEELDKMRVLRKSWPHHGSGF